MTDKKVYLEAEAQRYLDLLGSVFTILSGYGTAIPNRAKDLVLQSISNAEVFLRSVEKRAIDITQRAGEAAYRQLFEAAEYIFNHNPTKQTMDLMQRAMTDTGHFCGTMALQEFGEMSITGTEILNEAKGYISRIGTDQNIGEELKHLHQKRIGDLEKELQRYRLPSK